MLPSREQPADEEATTTTSTAKPDQLLPRDCSGLGSLWGECHGSSRNAHAQSPQHNAAATASGDSLNYSFFLLQPRRLLPPQSRQRRWLRLPLHRLFPKINKPKRLQPRPRWHPPPRLAPPQRCTRMTRFSRLARLLIDHGVIRAAREEPLPSRGNNNGQANGSTNGPTNMPQRPSGHDIRRPGQLAMCGEIRGTTIATIVARAALFVLGGCASRPPSSRPISTTKGRASPVVRIAPDEERFDDFSTQMERH